MDRPNENKPSQAKLPPGFTAMGLFLFFGMTMAGIAGTTLLWRGTSLNRIWVLNRLAYEQLVPLGRLVGALFLLLAVALGAAGWGWFIRRLWGWGVAVAIVTIQVFGDVINLISGDYLRGGLGFTIGAALLLYLLRADVREPFLRE